MNPKDSIKICVKTCPNAKLNTTEQFVKFAKLNGSLCLYNIRTDVYDSKSCPSLPIYRTYVLN